MRGRYNAGMTRAPMPRRFRLPLLFAGLLSPLAAWAAVPVQDLTADWPGMAAVTIFVVAYVLVVAEEFTGLRKSQPVMLAAGAIWAVLAFASSRMGVPEAAHEAVRDYLLEFAELLLFLLAAMTYVNAMSERGLFEALRARLLRRGLGYRALFWTTGALGYCGTTQDHTR